MKRDRSKRKAEKLCHDLHDDDGVDPRVYFSNRQRKKGHQTDRLAAELRRLTEHFLVCECEDEALGALVVGRVIASDDGTRLIVELVAPNDDRSRRLGIERRLELLAGRLRHDLAADVHRRRVPHVVMRLVHMIDDVDEMGDAS